MTHDLGPEARALLDSARGALGPDAAAISRMRAKIDAAIAGGVGAGAGAAAGAGSGTGAGAGAGAGAKAGAGAGALAAKIGVIAVVAAVAVGAIVYGFGRRGEPAGEPRVELAVRPEMRRAAEAPAPRAQAAAEPVSEPAIEMDPPERAAEPKQAPRPPAAGAPAPAHVAEATRPAHATEGAAPSRPSAPSASAPSASAPTAPSAAPAGRRRADLAREVARVDQAMAALRGGQPSAALAAVRLHATETAGAGQLAEDAAAIEIEALCRMHDASVATRLAAFDARWPQSAQRSRLTTRCP